MDPSATQNPSQRRYGYKQERLIREAHGTVQTIAMYRELLAIAERYGNEPEVEHISRCLREFEAETDDIVERAIELGLEPDDLYQAPRNTPKAQLPPASSQRRSTVTQSARHATPSTP